MKTVAALIASLLLSSVAFMMGVFGTIFYLASPDPSSVGKALDVSDMWTSEPIVVARNTEQKQRDGTPEVPELHVRSSANASSPIEQFDEVLDVDLDGFVTGATSDTAGDSAQHAAQLPREHQQWCAAKYNSYSPEDNTYQPYGGSRRRCVSPFLTIESEQIAPMTAPSRGAF